MTYYNLHGNENIEHIIIEEKIALNSLSIMILLLQKKIKLREKFDLFNEGK